MRCRKYCVIVSLAVVLVALACSPLQARFIEGAPNEVDDPWFEGTGVGWYVEGTPGPPVFIPNSDTPHTPPYTGNYLDPGRTGGESAFIRTIVDDYDGLWNSAYSQKEIDFSFFVHLAGDGYVNVRFDWWFDETMERPSNDPNDQSSPTPDGYSDLYTITCDPVQGIAVSEDFTNHGFQDEAPDWMDLWSFHDTWDIQPRWVSIEIEAGVLAGSQIGGEALITGIDFEARCVPEPSTLVMLCIGAFGLIAYVWRRR